MSRRYVNQLANGESVDDIFLVADKQLRANRQGNLYLHLDLRDRTGTINARLWNVTEEQASRFDAGDYLATRGKVQVFQGTLQLILSHVEPIDATGVEPSEYLPQPTHNVAELTARLRKLLMGLSDPFLRALGECFLIDDVFLTRYTTAPAGIKNHHAYHGGLLEHTVTMMTVAERIAPLYPEVHADLLLMGIFLHDIGKIHELTYDRSFGYSDEGQLVGHLVQGVVILREKARLTADLTGEPFPEELLLRLEHMIVSHHGTPEHGSIKQPMTPEAVALHYIDNLDAKLHLYTREIRDDPSRESTWTPYNPNLGRRLYKGGAGRNGSEAESLD